MKEQERYIQILRENLQKKERLLQNLLTVTKEQQAYIFGDEFEMDVFSEMMDVKDQLLDELLTVDDGFEAVFERIRQYMKEHEKELTQPIREMQNRVREITRLSVSIQAAEERNRAQLEKIFAAQQKKINDYRRSSSQVNRYYRSMNTETGNPYLGFNQKK